MPVDSVVELMVGFRTKANTSRLRQRLESGRWRRAFTPWLGHLGLLCFSAAMKVSEHFRSKPVDRFPVKGKMLIKASKHLGVGCAWLCVHSETPLEP